MDREKIQKGLHAGKVSKRLDHDYRKGLGLIVLLQEQAWQQRLLPGI
jgi:hypothetical protein